LRNKNPGFGWRDRRRDNLERESLEFSAKTAIIERGSGRQDATARLRLFCGPELMADNGKITHVHVKAR